MFEQSIVGREYTESPVPHAAPPVLRLFPSATRARYLAATEADLITSFATIATDFMVVSF